MSSLERRGDQPAWYVLLPKKGEHEGSCAPQPSDQNNQSIENFLQHQHVFSPCWCNMLLPSLQVNSAWTWPRLTSYPRTSQNVKVSSFQAQKHATFCEAESCFCMMQPKIDLTFYVAQQLLHCCLPFLLITIAHHHYREYCLARHWKYWLRSLDGDIKIMQPSTSVVSIMLPSRLSGPCCFVLMLLAWQWQLLSETVPCKIRFPLSLLFSRPNKQTNKPSSFLIWQAFKSFDHPCFPSLDAFQPVCMFLLHGRF